MLEFLKKILDWSWTPVVFLAVNLGILIVLANIMSEMNSEISDLQKDKIQLLENGETLYEINTDLLIKYKTKDSLIDYQQRIIDRQQELIKKYKDHLEWLRDNVLPQSPPPYDPDTIT